MAIASGVLVDRHEVLRYAQDDISGWRAPTQNTQSARLASGMGSPGKTNLQW
jgi:hypothetical protein